MVRGELGADVVKSEQRNDLKGFSFGLRSEDDGKTEAGGMMADDFYRGSHVPLRSLSLSCSLNY